MLILPRYLRIYHSRLTSPAISINRLTLGYKSRDKRRENVRHLSLSRPIIYRNKILGLHSHNNIIILPFSAHSISKVFSAHSRLFWKKNEHGDNWCSSADRETKLRSHTKYYGSKHDVDDKNRQTIVIDTPSGVPLNDYINSRRDDREDQGINEESLSTTTLYSEGDSKPSETNENLGNERNKFGNYFSNQVYEMSLDELENVAVEVEGNGHGGEMDIMHKVMKSCAQFGSTRGADLAERILTVVLLENKTKKRQGPTREMYAVAMDAWAKSQQSSHSQHRAERINAGQRAQQILEFMWEEYHSNSQNEKKSVKPDVIHYTIVLQALAGTSSRKAVHIAESLLKDAERLSGIHDLLKDTSVSMNVKKSSSSQSERPLDANLVPDRACYNTMLYNLSRYFKSENDVKRSMTPPQIMDLMWKIIRRMEDIASLLKDDDWLPNTRTYNLLLKSCGSHLKNSGEESEKILIEMCQRYHDRHKTHSQDVLENLDDEDYDENINNSVLPNIKSYNAVINSWSHNKSTRGTARAEEILRALLKKGITSLPPSSNRIRPLPIVQGICCDIVTFNSVLNTWAKSESVEAGERAEAILNYLTDFKQRNVSTPASNGSKFHGLFKDKEIRSAIATLQIQPDVITYNSVIKAWSQCSGGAQRAEQVLNRLLNEAEREHLTFNNTKGVLPNAISFSATIHAWAKTNEVKGGEKSENLLDRMQVLYRKSKDDKLKPSEACHTGVISAWLNCEDRSCAEKCYDKAEKALVKMKEDGFYPNISVYNSVLSAFAKTGINGFDRASSARHILMSMIIDATRSNDAAKPDVYSFHHVIKSSLNCTGGSDSRKNNLFSAIDTFNSLCQSDNCQPDYQTFILILKVIQTLMPKESTERTKLCEHFFRQTCESSLLTNAVIRILENLLPLSSWKRLESCRTDSETDLLTVYALPSEWSSKRRIGQNQRRIRKGRN